MTDWRAVGAGFVVAMALGFVAPGLGHLAGGLLASFLLAIDSALGGAIGGLPG